MKKMFDAIFKLGTKNKKQLVQSPSPLLNKSKSQIKETKLENPKTSLETPQSENIKTQHNIFQDW